MAQPAARTPRRTLSADDLGTLIRLVSEGYVVTYRGSSLKVRRRYRRLIVALEKRRAQELSVEVTARGSSTKTASSAPPAGS
ncbi:hypothetical protein [Truepera radiovictrix]|uniref:N-acetylmuramic acid-6-phosphate etherase n=1 Tax=Truepera radiovictrix (strain DSM 17093 / CIP 108686 / LMG 22925 / RQ-24) TaxID=649638 RepID=D7CQZ1_TRURR|nr:hypothetical protein [Truepera radiovictrix]ADI15125.1 N-acetylmuramic acid-6-phosphate etherase [Truepera radiovictrix DSM 17093]WMT56322.1 hypothetical protein RCV51_09935 [Truepera radiovictrix]